MELMRRREDELSKIYTYAGKGFLLSYIVGVAGFYVLRGRSTPYFKDVIKHGFLAAGGTFGAAMLSEKLASEIYYNRILI
jgi:hypothetical protein